ncbi:MAG: EpsG family protein [Muribaculaceae bacterium]|nr:EpsG family protein [Muribaculaceae bacterium]
MIPYILFAAVILVLHHYRMAKTMIVVMLLFAALRYDTGWDYHMYASFSHESHFFTARRMYSWFWTMIFSIGRETGLDWLPISITACLIYPTLYIGLKSLYRTNTRGLSDALLVYALWPFLYMSSLSTLRQNLAMAIGICIFACLNSRMSKWGKILALAAMYYAAFLCHPSSLILFGIIPVYMFRKKLSLKLAAIVMIMGFLILMSLKSLFVLLQGSAFSRYEMYLDMEDSYGGLVSILLVLIEVYLLYTGLKKKRKRLSVEFQEAYFMSVLGVGLLAGVYLFLNTSVVSRMVEYYSMFMIFTIYPCASMLPKPRYVRAGISAAMASLFIFYLIHTSDVTSDIASSRYVPYQTIMTQ